MASRMSREQRDKELTDAHENAKLTQQQAADVNRTYKLVVWRELERLYKQLIDPSFIGTATIELNAKDGRIARPKTIISQIHNS